jgi:predicted ferric reductase
MFNLSGKNMQAVAWGLALVVCGLSFIAWGEGNSWNFSHLSTYQVFPLLGLLAFSLMWSHYILGTLKEVATSNPDSLKNYYRWTGYAVLVLICLHPGLLIYQLFHDGQGLPPGSYEKYVAPGLAWVTLLGTASLLVFLAFEFHRVFGKKSWWHYVADLSDLAMLAIVYHGLRLGSQLQMGWYRYVWWLFAVTLLAVLARKYYFKLGFGSQKARP